MKIDVLGVKIDNITMEGALDRVEKMIEGGGKHQVVTPNPEHLVMAQEDKEFREILNSASLAIPDGIGLILASRLQEIFNFSAKGGSVPGGQFSIFNQEKGDEKTKEQVLKQRVTGTDLMINLCREAAQKNWSIFFLGGEKGVAQKAAERLQQQFPGLVVTGTSSADPQQLKTENCELKTDTDLLFVAYGAPAQEKWIARHLKNLPVKVAVGVGGAFDFVVGKQERAPQAFRRLGLEWLWRLFTEPWRWRRQRRLLRFIVLIVGNMLQSRCDHA